MTLFSTVGLLKHVEINLLKEKIKKLESSEAILKTFYENEVQSIKEKSIEKLHSVELRNEEENKSLMDAHEKEVQENQRKTKMNKEMYENERLRHQNTKSGARNSDIVLKLLMEAITNFDHEIKAFQDMNDKQEKMIMFKELENEDFLEQTMKLTKVVETMQGLVKKEDTSQKRLQRVLLKEREICESYSVISKLDMETPDYLTFIREMGKTLKDQHTIIEELQ